MKKVCSFFNIEELKNGEGRRITPKGISKKIELLEISKTANSSGD
jgi:hypothetical protein